MPNKIISFAVRTSARARDYKGAPIIYLSTLTISVNLINFKAMMLSIGSERVSVDFFVVHQLGGVDTGRRICCNFLLLCNLVLLVCSHLIDNIRDSSLFCCMLLDCLPINLNCSYLKQRDFDHQNYNTRSFYTQKSLGSTVSVLISNVNDAGFLISVVKVHHRRPLIIKKVRGGHIKPRISTSENVCKSNKPVAYFPL